MGVAPMSEDEGADWTSHIADTVGRKRRDDSFRPANTITQLCDKPNMMLFVRERIVAPRRGVDEEMKKLINDLG